MRALKPDADDDDELLGVHTTTSGHRLCVGRRGSSGERGLRKVEGHVGVGDERCGGGDDYEGLSQTGRRCG